MLFNICNKLSGGVLQSFVTVCLLAFCAVSCGKNPGTPPSAMDGYNSGSAWNLTVSGTSTGATLMGVGVELDPHFLSQNVTRRDGATELDWKRTVVKRCRAMEVQRYRVMLLPHWWEPSNDNSDPNVFDWSAFTFDNKEMESLYAVLDLAEETGADVTLVLWGCPISANTVANGNIGRHFLADNGTNWVTGTNDSEEFAENFVALYKYLKETKNYTCIKELTPYNEPNGNTTSFTNYVSDCKALDAKLKAEGLRDGVKLNLSDNTDNALNWLQASALSLSSQADLFNSHCYIFGYKTSNAKVISWEEENVKAAAKAGKAHFVGEFGSDQTVGATRQKDINTYKRGVLMPRLAVNFLNAGASGVSYWSLIDQYYLRNEAYAQMQQLGLWIYKNSAYQSADLGGIKGDYTCRPQYYSYGLLTRFVRKGSTVYPIQCKDDFVAATAVCSSDGKWTYIFANGSSKDVSCSLSNSMEGGLNNCDVYRYAEDELPSDDRLLSSVQELSSDGEAFHLFIPENSVLVLTQIKY